MMFTIRAFRRRPTTGRVMLGWLTVQCCCCSAVAQTFPITVDTRAAKAPPVVGVQHGVPIIQIAPPSAGGVSKNRFTQFNVGPAGAVLNNSGGASQTQLAGLIAGNPMLGNQRAKTILNQVTAPNPSQLHGMLEVAGHRANVIVANPAGIICNGCGFLNASRATLTTGRPDVGPKGHIAFDVASGLLMVEGQGLNGTHVDQVDLMARALTINAGVWANRLTVIAGAARVDAASGQTRPIDGHGPAPEFALDTAALGGMYANSIRLIGTEAGVGVNIGGNLVALTGDLTVNAAGDVRIAPNGTLSAQKRLALHTTGNLDTRQATLHGTNVAVSARILHNQKGSITAAGPITLRLQGELRNNDGLIAAAGNHRIESAYVINHGGTLAGGNLTVEAKEGIENHQGAMTADNTLHVSAVRLANNETAGKTVAAASNPAAALGAMPPVSSPALAAPGASSTEGASKRETHSAPSPLLMAGLSGKAVDIRVDLLNNTNGAIRAGNNLTIVLDELKNQSGHLTAQRNVSIDTRVLHNKAGTLFAGQQLSVHAKQQSALGSLHAGTDLIFTYSGSLTPQDNFLAGRDLSLNLGGALANKSRLVAGRDLRIKADSLSNSATGELLAGRHNLFTVKHDVSNAGLIDAQSTRINAAQIHNRGRIYGDHVSLAAGALINDAGPKSSASIASRGNLDVGVGTLTNRHHSVLYAARHLRIGGSLDAARRVTGQADHLQNNAATIEAGGNLDIAAHQIHNQNANFVSKDVQVSARPKVYFTPEGGTETLDAAHHWLCNSVARGCSHRPEWLNDDPKRGLLLPSGKYPAERYGPPFDYAPNEPGWPGVSSPIALTYMPAGRKCVGRDCSPTPERFRYARDAHVWKVFNVAPPVGELPSWPDLARRARSRAELQKHRKAYEATPAYKDHKARHMTLNARIKAFNSHFNNRLARHFTFYEVKEIATETRAVSSDPGSILSAGALTLTGTVTNDKSQIAAAGKLRVKGPEIHNIGATGWRTVTREGQATFTQARSNDRKAHRSPYKVTVTRDPFELPVGTLRSIVAPKVQLPARLGASQTHGTLMAGRNTQITSDGNVFNSGTIGALESTVVSAKNIVNHSGGQIQARRIDLAARENIASIAAQIHGDTVALRAGQNINLISTEGSEDFGSTRGTHLSGISRLSANDLLMQAGNDIHLLAAQVSVEHNARLQAGRDVRLDTLTARHAETIATRAHQRHELSTTQAIGAVANSKGDMAIAAGQDVSAHAAQVDVQRNLMIEAGRDVVMQSVAEHGTATDQYREKKKGFLSSKTTDTHTSVQWEKPHATTVTGQHVEITAGRDVSVHGSNVGAQQDLDISAARDVNIEPGHQQSEYRHVERVKKSGIGATGGISVGTYKKKHVIQENVEGNTRSTLGSLQGNATIHSGQSANVTAGIIVAPKGNITVTGEQVTIGAGLDTRHRHESLHMKQSGVSVNIDVPMMNTVQAIERMIDTADKTDNALMQSLAAAAAGLGAVNDIGAVQAQAGADGAKAMSNVRVSINLGTSKQSARTDIDASTAVGSIIAAGQNLAIIAEGAGPDSHISVDGSQLSAGADAVLNAEGNIHLRATENTLSIHRKSSSAGASIGVAVTMGQGGASFGFEATASGARGRADGRDTTMTNTHLTAGGTLSVKSGADTHMRGAVASGEHVDFDVGGNLNIESIQDTSVFKSKDQSAGASMVVGAGFSGSADYAQSNVNGDFASVREQSAIQAGDAGFDVRVGGNTNLKGAVIASTDEAVQAGVNRVSTRTLTVSDIENHSAYKATGVALSGGFGMKADKNAGEKGDGSGDGKQGSVGSERQFVDTDNASQNDRTSVAGTIAPGFSHTSGKARSTTTSGIGGAIIINDHDAQRALTGQTATQLLASLNQDVRTGSDSDSLSKTWDPEALRTKVAAEAEIVAAFTQQASQTIHTYTEEKRAALRAQITGDTDDQTKQTLQKKISALNTQERLMNIVVGALAGSGGIAATRAALSEAADHMREYVIEDSKKFAGITDGVTTLDNIGGKSVGVRGDGKKMAGVRVVLDVLCGTMNERCAVHQDANGKDILDKRGIPELKLNEKRMIQFDPRRADKTLAQFLETREGQNIAGLTGGLQGGEGTLNGEFYHPGGVLDLVHEGFAGSHDFISGTVSGFYDDEGNARRGLDSVQKALYEVWSAVALVPAAPFALSEVLPPEAWQALDVLLELRK